MKRTIRHTTVLFCASLVLGAAILSSCATTPREDRGSLSDAMDKSRDDHEGSRRVPDRPRDPYPRDPFPRDTYPDRRDRPDGRQTSGTDDDGDTSGAIEPINGEIFFGLRGGSSLAHTEDLERDADADLILGLGTERFDALLYAGFKAAEPIAGSDLDASIDGGLLFLRAGLEGRYLLFPETAFLSPYLGAGIGAFIMGWTFTNPLAAGTDLITGDSLSGCILSLSAGAYLARNDRVSLGVSIVPEVYLYDYVTAEGFDNDYFLPYSTVKIMGELLFR